MFLHIEDLVPNAPIEVIESNAAQTLSYPAIVRYGHQVIIELKKDKSMQLY